MMNRRRAEAAAAALVLGLGIACQACGVSLYDEGSFQPLTADRKARKAGDLVTVMIYENASASSSADTNAGRSSDLAASVQAGSREHHAGISTNNDFEGKGTTQRSGRVLGQLTVAVQQVLPNGDLVLGGTQELEINGEKQLIKLEGRVRALDVSESNTVLSTRVADARISFAGDGVLSEHQKPSWWHRLLTWFGV
jgi:flagellar L-ring protein precursor FlgH